MPQQRIDCEFCFHNVGQGLFYTGYVADFRFIYDCGSQIGACAEKAVLNYCSAIQGNSSGKVSLLVLSHLHHDHVSGLKALFERVTVEVAVLPYLRPWERLLLACVVTGYSPWYLDMLRDPVGFLSKYKVGRVVLITHGWRGEPNDRHSTDSAGRSGPDKVGDTPVDMSELADLDEDRLNKIFQKEEENGNDWRRLYRDGKLMVKTHYGIFRLRKLWEFVIYNQPVSDDWIEDFRNCVSQLAARTDYNKFPLRLLKDSNCLKELRRCYREDLMKGRKDLNFTSLALWHGPINPDGWKMEWGHCPCYASDATSRIKFALKACSMGGGCSFVADLSRNLSFGQLLTGDMNLNNNYEGFKKHFGTKLESTAVCLVPHHGSARNWNNNILKDLRSCKVWVISAGLENRYYHPHKQVLRDLLQSGQALCWVHEKLCLVIK
ncbi:MAG: MBL fold metallo-hydrolase [Thermanaeromonas sp.]|uniref:MBL fold metallo-hydrolase n=1 Tax=Thermanaeromonas sp. TaxID=2003697 RepID=UPI00243B16CA|nr:MBL fold metallo-hydrolase [Thermanaeromonas sp.]MCG0277747.1 MBL fold metallo-hydrolase [Thermanaeromonas sp.]